MQMETLFAGRLHLSPLVPSAQYFCSSMVYPLPCGKEQPNFERTMKAAAEAHDSSITKLICSTCKEETTDWTRLTTIVIWQVSAVHTNYHRAMYNPAPVHVPPGRSTTLRYITSVRRGITRPT